jgi:glucose-6-phosphate 1-dehydrogenase
MATVLNIVGVRFANRIVEPVLNAEHVESVDIVFDEDLGLEGRAGYYDGAGAMVDMLQSHLLQVLSLVAMDAPPTLSDRDLSDCRAQVLRAARVWDDDPVASSYRARYTAGEIDGRRFPSYVDEDGIDPSRNTETLAELVLAVDSWRWSGVPFRLRSGKALGDPRKEVVINFKRPQRVPDGLTGCDQPNRLRIGIFRAGPDRLCLDFNISGPGDPSVIDPVTLEADFGRGQLFEYGEVLKGVLEGDPTLSVRGDMAVDCWRIIEPVQRAWRDGAVPLEEYPAGSGGPDGWPL